ncbi:MAG: hypothetical protein MZV63_15785 [Marinilabiliales bacterium]|nr:hypothetical protein [Marinilabiliales bacterium]
MPASQILTGLKNLYQNILEKGAEAQKLEVAFNNVLDEIGKIKVIYDLNLNEYRESNYLQPCC